MKYFMKFMLPLCLAAAQSAVADERLDGEALVKLEWQAQVQNLMPIGERLAKLMPDLNDPQLRREMYRMIYAGISIGYFGRFLGDRDHPDFWPMLTMAHPFWAPNPDNVYYLAPIDSAGIYHLTGFRGTVPIVDLQTGAGTVIPDGTGKLGPTFDNYDLDTLHISRKGEFDFVLSRVRPADYTGDWLAMNEQTTYILIRQIANDWINEIDARFAIERLDRPAIKPRQSAAEIDENLIAVASWAEIWPSVGLNWVNRNRARDLTNKVTVNDMNAAGGTSKQMYIEGMFDLKPEEALILEFEAPKQCRYWNVQVTDAMWNTIDYMNRQSHLNAHLATIDQDGRFRAVISATDPGVSNWLDTADYKEGTITGRLRECATYPTPSLSKILFKDLSKHLPKSTPAFSAEQREQQIRLRKRGAQLRRRW